MGMTGASAPMDSLSDPVDGLTKGFPHGHAMLPIGRIGSMGWRLLDGDVPMPAAVVREDRLRRNSRWMREFTQANGLLIAPHGKTTMAPWLFSLQMADGAFAITLATVHQMQVARRHGVRRVIIANQPVGRLAVDACFSALAESPDFELYCLADSLEGVVMLADGARRIRPGRPLRVLLEIGFTGGRTGCRDLGGAMQVARAVAAADGLTLAGAEAFEGILADTREVDGFLETVVAAARQCEAEGLFEAGRPIILSAGGTSFFDRVALVFGKAGLGRETLRVIRSGCYLTHDDIGYARHVRRIVEEGAAVIPEGGLEPALEVWAHVQSRPEPGKAIVTLGKRDAGFDAGLPVPKLWHRPGGAGAPQPLGRGHALTAMNDQHGHLMLPADSPLRVGDMVGFGIGHPCTTFDKWRMIYVIDAGYRITGAFRTWF